MIFLFLSLEVSMFFPNGTQYARIDTQFVYVENWFMVKIRNDNFCYKHDSYGLR